jgi:hypothetical protein
MSKRGLGHIDYEEPGYAEDTETYVFGVSLAGWVIAFLCMFVSCLGIAAASMGG